MGDRDGTFSETLFSRQDRATELGIAECGAVGFEYADGVASDRPSPRGHPDHH